MALIKCPECGREISSNAAACPHCGNPLPKKMCPVSIHREKTIYKLVYCNVYADRNNVGEVRNGDSLSISLPVGTHSIEVEFRSSGMPPQKSGSEIIIKETTKQVDIDITDRNKSILSLFAPHGTPQGIINIRYRE